MTIPKLTLATISILLFSCEQAGNASINHKSSSDSSSSSRTKIEVTASSLQDTTVQIAWREDQYDEKLKDSFDTIIVNEAFCKTLPDASRAALGYVATFIGNECWWDGETKKDRSNLRCKILTALDLGYQCSDKHLVFLRQWFRDDKKVLQELENCPTTPYTSTIQETFNEIKLSLNGNKIVVWFSASKINVREGDSWSWTETDYFQVDNNKIILTKVEKTNLQHVKFQVGE